jgi:hypothetical protein
MSQHDFEDNVFEINPAKQLEDLPPGVTIGVLGIFDEADRTMLSFTVYLADEEGKPLPAKRLHLGDYQPETNLTGWVRTSFLPECGVYEVVYSQAAPGWGPLLYDLAIEVASEFAGGLMSDRFSVSSDAARVWSYYLQRPDVDRVEVPGRPACFPHDPNATDYALSKSPDDLHALQAADLLHYYKERPPGSPYEHISLEELAATGFAQTWKFGKPVPLPKARRRRASPPRTARRSPA